MRGSDFCADLADSRSDHPCARRVAMMDLPVRQREVVTLRDIVGLSSAEVCGVLDISEANQRVLLHRGRSRLRQQLESEFGRA